MAPGSGIDLEFETEGRFSIITHPLDVKIRDKKDMCDAETSKNENENIFHK